MTYLQPNASLISKLPFLAELPEKILSKRDVSVFLEKTLCKFKHNRVFHIMAKLMVNEKRMEKFDNTFPCK